MNIVKSIKMKRAIPVAKIDAYLKENGVDTSFTGAFASFYCRHMRDGIFALDESDYNNLAVLILRENSDLTYEGIMEDLAEMSYVKSEVFFWPEECRKSPTKKMTVKDLTDQLLGTPMTIMGNDLRIFTPRYNASQQNNRIKAQVIDYYFTDGEICTVVLKENRGGYPWS